MANTIIHHTKSSNSPKNYFCIKKQKTYNYHTLHKTPRHFLKTSRRFWGDMSLYKYSSVEIFYNSLAKTGFTRVTGS